jgi:hypothetical protein
VRAKPPLSPHKPDTRFPPARYNLDAHLSPFLASLAVPCPSGGMKLRTWGAFLRDTLHVFKTVFSLGGAQSESMKLRTWGRYVRLRTIFAAEPVNPDQLPKVRIPYGRRSGTGKGREAGAAPGFSRKKPLNVARRGAAGGVEEDARANC